MPRARGHAFARAAFAILAIAAGACARPASAIVVVPRHPTEACTLFVFGDEVYSGCDEIEGGTTEAAYLTGVGSQAIAVMRAWRKKNATTLFRRFATSRDDSTTTAWRDSMIAGLNATMSRTLVIDSMAVAIVADSAAFASGVVASRYWIARTVLGRDVATAREIYRVGYLESWRQSPEGWTLLGMSSTDEARFYLAGESAGKSGFPIHPPRSASPGEAPLDEPPTDDRILDGADVPRDLAEGSLVGPFTRNCGDAIEGKFVYYEVEPVLVSAIPPTYPWEASDRRDEVEVTLRAFICRSGRVGWITVASGEPYFSAEAAIAVLKWVYSPATANGTPVGVWVEVPVKFRR